MAEVTTYTIDQFKGIDQSQPENRLAPGYTKDCANMNTENGNLAVGYGYKKHISTKVPTTDTIHRMYYWHTLADDKFIVCAGDKVYAWNGSSWDTIFDYSSLLEEGEHITSTKWDFVETRIGDVDYLIIANGQTRLIKWTGTGSATQFGTGEYVYSGTASEFKYNATKAVSVAYEEYSTSSSYSATIATKTTTVMTGTSAKITLTMPSGWTYSAGVSVSFLSPVEGTKCSQIIINDGTNDHTLSYVPSWKKGDFVTVVLTGTTTANESAGSYVSTVGVFTVYMPEDWTSGNISFDVPKDMSSLSTLYLIVNDKKYKFSSVPIWSSGDTVVIELGEDAYLCTEASSSAATTVTYAEASNVGTYTLTMPTDWQYTDNCYVYFTVNQAKTSATSTVLNVNGTKYNMPEVQSWAAGDKVLVQLRSNTAVMQHTVATAESSTFVKTNYDGKLTLTMPASWTYTENDFVRFGVPQDVGTLSKMEIVIGDKTFGMEVVPKWTHETSGTVNEYMVRLADNREASESEEEYGITQVVLNSAIGSDYKQRCLDIGLVLDGTSEEVKEISDDRLTVTFKETVTTIPDLGCDAKVRGGVSDIAVNFVEIYYSRLFSAGDSEHPSRLYWSMPPGDTRTIEDWSQDENSEVTSGGYTEVGQTSSDPIIGLCALSNQLVIFKESSIYRLLGDRPSNYRVTAVNRDIETTINTAIIANGDVPYWITKAGLYYHDGQTAHLAANARQIHTLLESVSISTAKSCENRDRLYFTCKAGTGSYDDSIIIYDMVDRTYLLRNGFEVIDLCAFNGNMYMINSNRYVYVWDKDTDTYDGETIEAYWYTPMTDLGAMSFTKALKDMYARGSGEIVGIDTQVGKFVEHHFYQMPLEEGETLRIPMKNQGKVFGFKLYNQEGSKFTINGGLEVKYELKED